MIDSFKNLTIEKHYELLELQKEEMELLERQVAIIAILDNTSEEDVLNLPIPEYREKVQKTEFLFTQPKPSNRLPDIIMIGTRKFKVMKDVSKWTAGQYIDFQTYIKNNMGTEYLISCTIIPDGKKYGEYNIEEVIEYIKKNLTVQTAIDITNFFQTALQRLIAIIKISLGWKIKKMARKAKTPAEKMRLMEAKKMMDLIANGAGQSLLMKYQN